VVQQERQGIAKERDELKQQIAVAQGHFEQFRQNLKTLLGQMESTSIGPPAAPTALTSEDAKTNKS
jgi:hypothetical protein